MSWNRLRGHLVNRLRDHFGHERSERETAVAPSDAVKEGLPLFIGTIWGRVDLDEHGFALSEAQMLAGALREFYARIDRQVYAALLALNCPADLTAIRLTHWLNTDSFNYPRQPFNLRASLARLTARGYVIEITRFWGLRKKWVVKRP